MLKIVIIYINNTATQKNLLSWLPGARDKRVVGAYLESPDNF